MHVPVFASAFLFLSLTAHAEPKVGDKTIFDVATRKLDRNVNYTSVTELVQYDAENHRYLMRETRKEAGHTDLVKEVWKEAEDMLSDEKVDRILADCRDAGGAPDTVTVPAGKFDACILPVDADETQPASGWIWIAKVRFGIVRQQITQDGETSIANLRSFY